MTRHRIEWLWQQNQIKPPSEQCPWGLDDPSGGEAFSYIFNSFACALPPSEHSHAQRPHHHHTRLFFANVSSSDLSSLLPCFLSSDKFHRFWRVRVGAPRPTVLLKKWASPSGIPLFDKDGGARRANAHTSKPVKLVRKKEEGKE